MKICYVSPVDSIHIQRWIKHFVNKGYEITLLSTKKGEIAGAKVVYLDFYDRGIPRNVFLKYFRAILDACKFRKIINMVKADIVHVHCIPTSSMALAFWRLKNLVVSTWGSDVVYDNSNNEPWILKFFKRFILKQAKVITTISEFLRKRVAEYAPKSSKIYVIPFGINCELFSPTKKERNSLNPETITLGFVKHLKPKYGPEYLIEAMPRIIAHYAKTYLIMVGSGHMKQELEHRVRKLGIQDKVEFTGDIPHDQVPATMSKIDIFVMPSVFESESLGVAALEASAMEIPVVATKVGGVPEVVEDGSTGILVPARNSDKLAEVIVKLIKNPQLRAQMGKRGRELVLKKYRWEGNTADMERLYQSLSS